jgi:hypothetical protein
MWFRKLSSVARKAEFGSFRLKTTVRSSGAVMPGISLLKSGPFCQSVTPTTFVHSPEL